MNYHNPDLPEFLDAEYLPNHEKIPGYLGITCKYEKQPGWEKEGGFVFQYLDGKLFYRCYPSLVQYPLGEAASVEEAIEKAWQFLQKWISLDPKHLRFQIDVSGEIRRLEEEKEAAKRAQREKDRVKYEDLDENKKRIVDEIMKVIIEGRKKRGKG
ncbi:MAG: hypothetical protein Kow0070_28680 [Anaerolineales bacterium]